MKRSSLRVVRALAILTASCVPLSATTIYSTFPSDGVSFDQSQPLTISFTTSPNGYSGYATSFTPTQDFILTDISVYVAFEAGGALANVDIYSGTQFGGPSTLLGTGQVGPGYTSAAIPAQVYNTTITPATSGSDALTPGTVYWVAVLPTPTDPQWFQNPMVPGALAHTTDGSAWNVQGESQAAYTQVNGYDPATVPEPHTALLMLSGLPLLLLFRRRAA